MIWSRHVGGQRVGDPSLQCRNVLLSLMPSLIGARHAFRESKGMQFVGQSSYSGHFPKPTRSASGS